MKTSVKIVKKTALVMPKPETLEDAILNLYEAERILGYHHAHTKRLMRLVNRYRFGDK